LRHQDGDLVGKEGCSGSLLGASWIISQLCSHVASIGAMRRTFKLLGLQHGRQLRLVLGTESMHRRCQRWPSLLGVPDRRLGVCLLCIHGVCPERQLRFVPNDATLRMVQHGEGAWTLRER